MCVWCKLDNSAAIHDLGIIEAVQKALDEAREEGRQEIRDRMNDAFDRFAPTSVSWWNEVEDEILLPAWKHGTTNSSKA